MTTDGFLLAYFSGTEDEDGEQVRFAVTDGSEPIGWTELNGGAPTLFSTVGELGARDPFLLRDTRNGRFVVIATDLKTWTDGDWDRAVRRGSRSLVVWESDDLTSWSEPRLIEVSPLEAGNTWAPKAFWSTVEETWLVFWASALYPETSDRSQSSYQRIMVARTDDFRSFGPPSVHLDFGHDVIDATFLEHGGTWYRFSANALNGGSEVGHHIFEEVGSALEEPDYKPLAVDIGKDVMVRAEGPAVASSIDGKRWYLLADEFGLRGYQLFETDDLSSGHWRHIPHAKLPKNARHGSMLPISGTERAALLATRWPG